MIVSAGAATAETAKAVASGALVIAEVFGKQIMVKKENVHVKQP